MEKKCSRCGYSKPLSEFNKCKTGSLGHHNHCRGCQRLARRQYYVKNREKEIEKSSKYSKSDKGLTTRRKFYNEHRDELLEKNRTRRATPRARRLANIARKKRCDSDPSFRLACNLRKRTRKSLKGISKSQSTIELLGCSIENLKIHLENQFSDGMSWDNYNYHGWHVDHIIPCSSFDLSDPAQQKKCFHWSNLQPMWCIQNLSKGNRPIP